jgi:hypothetical protein
VRIDIHVVRNKYGGSHGHSNELQALIQGRERILVSEEGLCVLELLVFETSLEV